MRRFILVAIVLGVAVAGCNRFPDNGLQIGAMLPPSDDCTFSADSEVRLLVGRYDLAYRRPDGSSADYIIAPLLRSYLIDYSLEFQADQNNLQVTDFEVTILLPDGTKPDLGALVNPYRVNTTAVLLANESEGSSSEEVAAAIGIPASYQDALSALLSQNFSQVLLDVRASGTTFGGFTQRSAPFRFPVELCQGCLNNCLAEVQELADSCLPGQDVWQYCN